MHVRSNPNEQIAMLTISNLQLMVKVMKYKHVKRISKDDNVCRYYFKENKNMEHLKESMEVKTNEANRNYICNIDQLWYTF